MNTVMINSPTPNFSDFPDCPCSTLKENILNPPIYLEMEQFFKDRGIEFTKHTGATVGWRMRAKLAVRGDIKNPLIGLFKEGTHQVVPIPNCQMHHPSINKAVSLVKDAMIACEVRPYQENKHKGILRYLQLAVEENTSLVQLSLVVFSKELPKEIKELVFQLKKNPIWHSIWVNFHPTPSNRIWGDDWTLLFGKTYLVGNSHDLPFYFHPACFTQAHFSLFKEMLSSISKNTMMQMRVAEFYAGTGMIGFHVVKESKSVICSDTNPFAEECFERTLAKLSANDQTKISYLHASALDAANLVNEVDVVILDPPRKGLDPVLLENLVKSENVKQIVYVSCYWKSFIRDFEKLESVGWKVKKAEGYLFFPGNDHLETLCFLEKN